MGSQANQLRELIQILTKEVEKLKKEIQEYEEKIGVAKAALELLIDQGMIEDQVSMFADKISNKYAGLSRGEAIIRILSSDTKKRWKAKEIEQELRLHGYQSKSKNFLRDVYVLLNRMTKKGKVAVDNSGKVKRYYLPTSPDTTSGVTIKEDFH